MSKLSNDKCKEKYTMIWSEAMVALNQFMSKRKKKEQLLR